MARSGRKQLTPLQVEERHNSNSFGPGRGTDDLVWLVDWRAMGLPNCCVYVIAPIDGWPCKIGISASPHKRVSALQTASWKQLRVYWSAHLPSAAEARALEAKAHAVLTERNLWLHGEWFDLRPDKAIELLQFEAAIAGLDVNDRLAAGSPEFQAAEAVYRKHYYRMSGMMEKLERDNEYWGR